MGSAIAHLMTRNGMVAGSCFVFDRNPERRMVCAVLSCTVAQSLDELIANSDILLLAVKPQNASELFDEMRGRIASRTIISIMAGIQMSTIARGLETSRIIRAMPNMPARIGKSMTVWTAHKEVSGEEKEAARQLFSLMGRELEVVSEDKIDAATAISGSGPAYVFLLAESLEAAALHLGFSAEESGLLVRETLRGASELYAGTNESPAVLRGAVTSQGGTTAAAMEILDPAAFMHLWQRAVKSAYGRAKELRNATSL